MIIWGSKAKQRQIATGNFYCPNCRGESAFSHLRVSRYFTLYFIPLFPTSTLGEAVRCITCSGEFNTKVLTFTPAQIEAAVQPWACGECGNRNPKSEARCLACGALPQSTPPPLSSGAVPPSLPQ